MKTIVIKRDTRGKKPVWRVGEVVPGTENHPDGRLIVWNLGAFPDEADALFRASGRGEVERV